MFSLTVCGLWPRDARFSFFCARSGGGSKAFSLVGLGGARFRAPLPVLIPRVKNGLPADACAPFGFARWAYLPSEPQAVLRCISGPARRSARDNPLNCQQRPLPRGAGAFVPPADIQRPFPLHGASHGGEVAERKARRFSAKQARRKSAALFLPAQSVISRSYFGFELRARADSPLSAVVSLRETRRGHRPALVVARLSAERSEPTKSGAMRGARRCRGRETLKATLGQFNNCLVLARRLAPPTGSPRCGSATLASLGAFPLAFRDGFRVS